MKNDIHMEKEEALIFNGHRYFPYDSFIISSDSVATSLELFNPFTRFPFGKSQNYDNCSFLLYLVNKLTV